MVVPLPYMGLVTRRVMVMEFIDGRYTLYTLYTTIYPYTLLYTSIHYYIPLYTTIHYYIYPYIPL